MNGDMSLDGVRRLMSLTLTDTETLCQFGNANFVRVLVGPRQSLATHAEGFCQYIIGVVVVFSQDQVIGCVPCVVIRIGNGELSAIGVIHVGNPQTLQVAMLPSLPSFQQMV